MKNPAVAMCTLLFVACVSSCYSTPDGTGSADTDRSLTDSGAGAREDTGARDDGGPPDTGGEELVDGGGGDEDGGAIPPDAAGDGAGPEDAGVVYDGGVGQDGGGPVCSGPGVDGAGLCSTVCGAAAPCQGLKPGDYLNSCQGAGNPAVKDSCNPACLLEDRPEMICRKAGVFDCQGDEACENVKAGSNGCDQNCKYSGGGCTSGGRIAVSIDGDTVFDRHPSKSLICLNLHFDPGQYGSGPPGASIQVVNEQPGLLEADLTGFKDDHENCGEKWGFVKLVGACADVLLEKWNANVCSPYYTPQLKLETWVDTDGDCQYSHTENDEPYGGDIHWDPGRTYRLKVVWE